MCGAKDDDFEGGNIVGARNVPSSTLSDEAFAKMASGPLREYKQVVFHCHLSQQRGPKAAGQYAQACRSVKHDMGDPQEVLVLRGGFSEFQDRYKVSVFPFYPTHAFAKSVFTEHRQIRQWWKSTMLPAGSTAIDDISTNGSKAWLC